MSNGVAELKERLGIAEYSFIEVMNKVLDRIEAIENKTYNIEVTPLKPLYTVEDAMNDLKKVVTDTVNDEKPKPLQFTVDRKSMITDCGSNIYLVDLICRCDGVIQGITTQYVVTKDVYDFVKVTDIFEMPFVKVN